jgi:alkylation response protein AidB-like acyl-CoA dehydrogenase
LKNLPRWPTIRCLGEEPAAMIDFALDDDLQILLDAVERFARERLTPAVRTAEAERAPAAATVRLYEDLGLMGLEAPGQGLGMVSRCLVNEVLGRGDPGAALALDRLGPAAYALWAAEDHEGIAEVSADPGRRAWLATPEDGIVNVTERTATGTLHFAPAGVTDLVILSPTGIAVIRAGIEETPVRGAGLRAAAPVRLTLADAPVARFHRVATGPVLGRARLYMASLLLGVLDAAATYAREYAQQRVAFGRPIAHHQALTFLLTDMNTAVVGARLLLQEAAWRMDATLQEAARRMDAAGPAGLADAEEASAAAFAEAVEQATFVGPNGVQVLGGLGFMQDYPVEKHMREARALGLLYGGSDLARTDAMRTLSTAIMAGGLF